MKSDPVVPTTELAEIVADNLQHLTNELTQTQVADKSGCSQKTVSNILRAKHEMQIGNLDKIAKGLGVPTWALLLPNLFRDRARANDVVRLVTEILTLTPESTHLLAKIAEHDALGRDN